MEWQWYLQAKDILNIKPGDLFMGLFSFFTQEIAIDLGTANTLIIYNDKIVVDEPSIIALSKETGKLIAIGEKARQMQGKTHEGIQVIRPLKDGVIADFNAAELMLRGMIKMIIPKSSFFYTVGKNGYLCSFRKY